MLRAAAERRFELPAEVLAVGVAQQELGQGASVWRDVEHFIRADACVGAGRDVANRISAGLTGGDARGGKAAHKTGGVLDMHVVKLKILPGGHVRDAVGILLRQLRQSLELSGVESAGGNLDALHPGASHMVLGPLVNFADG